MHGPNKKGIRRFLMKDAVPFLTEGWKLDVHNNVFGMMLLLSRLRQTEPIILPVSWRMPCDVSDLPSHILSHAPKPKFIYENSLTSYWYY